MFLLKAIVCIRLLLKANVHTRLFLLEANVVHDCSCWKQMLVHNSSCWKRISVHNSSYWKWISVHNSSCWKRISVHSSSYWKRISVHDSSCWKRMSVHNSSYFHWLLEPKWNWPEMPSWLVDGSTTHPELMHTRVELIYHKIPVGSDCGTRIVPGGTIVAQE